MSVTPSIANPTVTATAAGIDGLNADISTPSGKANVVSRLNTVYVSDTSSTEQDVWEWKASAMWPSLK
jgi:hypothetical protein